MKKIKFIYMALAFVAILNAASAQTNMEIKGGELKINGTKIQYPWTTAALTQSKTLGAPDRSDLGGSNDIFTYDTKGVMLYQTPNTTEVSAMNIYYGFDENNHYDFTPGGMYKGIFKVDGFLIKANTSLAEVKAKLPKYGFSKSVIGAYRGEYKNLYIYLQYDDAEKNIYWISIGKTK
jgi:hypothetical protein